MRVKNREIQNILARNSNSIILIRYAGCWTVGIAKTGNYVGMAEADLAKADPKLLAARMEVARQKLYEAGAHFVIDTVNDLPGVIDEINDRIREANFY